MVVTEGKQTEPQYVERLAAHLRARGTATTVKSVGVGKDPLRVIEKCVELRDAAVQREKPYDTCVCLVDVDQHGTLDRALRVASIQSIIVIVSRLKFEVWLRWHLEASRQALSSSQLDAVMNKHRVLDGKALSPGFPIAGVEDTCARAREADPDLAPGRVGPEPSSAMPVVVDLMRG